MMLTMKVAKEKPILVPDRVICHRLNNKIMVVYSHFEATTHAQKLLEFVTGFEIISTV